MKKVFLAILLMFLPSLALAETVSITGDNLKIMDSTGKVVDPPQVVETQTPPAPMVSVAAGDKLSAIQSKLNSVPGGGSLVFPTGTYALGGTLRGKSGVTLWADGVANITGPGAGTAGAFDFSNQSNWTVRGRKPGEGFVFSRTLVNAAGASNFAVGNNVFQEIASNGLDGSAIRMNGARGGTVINNVFQRAGGNVLGMYNIDAMTFDGNHFFDTWQPFSFQAPTTANRTLGRNIVFRRNVFLRTQRAAIEVGPASTGAEYFGGMVVENNFFDDFRHAPNAGQGTLLPISLVGQASENTTVRGNFIRRGSDPGSQSWAPAIEFTGTGICTGNVIWGWQVAGYTYQSGWNMGGNVLYQSGGFVNNGHGIGTFGDQTTTLAPPAVPPWPARITW